MIAAAPNVLLSYLQVVLNFSFVGCLLHSVFFVRSVIIEDLHLHFQDRALLNVRQSAGCLQEYDTNHCKHLSHIPALGPICDEWKQCMERDPRAFLKTQETLVLVAQTLNRFFDAMHYRTLFIGFGGILVVTLVLNLVLIRCIGKSTAQRK